jgi:hypothetical protein
VTALDVCCCSLFGLLICHAYLGREVISNSSDGSGKRPGRGKEAGIFSEELRAGDSLSYVRLRRALVSTSQNRKWTGLPLNFSRYLLCNHRFAAKRPASKAHRYRLCYVYENTTLSTHEKRRRRARCMSYTGRRLQPRTAGVLLDTGSQRFDSCAVCCPIQGSGAPGSGRRSPDHQAANCVVTGSSR